MIPQVWGPCALHTLHTSSYGPDYSISIELHRQKYSYSLLTGEYPTCDYSCGAFSRFLHAINFTAFHCKSFARLNCVHFNAYCVLLAIYLLIAAVVVAVAILCQFSREKFLRDQQRNGNATLCFTWRQNFTPAPKANRSAYCIHIHLHTHAYTYSHTQPSTHTFWL